MTEFHRDYRDRYFCFVYKKDDQLKVFNVEDAHRYEIYLKANHWKHLHTIDPVLWIEAIIQHTDADALDMIRSLRGE